MAVSVTSWAGPSELGSTGSVNSRDEGSVFRDFELPPTRSQLTLQSPPTAARPLPPIHQHAETAGPASTYDGQTKSLRSMAHDHDASPDGSVVLSLKACAKCQEALVAAFDHCLSKGNEQQPLMESVNQIDEVEDGRRLTDPPYFKIIKDPTRPRNTVYTDISQKVERERWAFNERRKGSKHEQPGNYRTPSTAAAHSAVGIAFGKLTTNIQSGSLFPGAVYKRTLEAKDKEIQMLREQLYERIAAEKTEQGDVQKLRGALKKAVNYYVYAEEWQAAESARLRRDVRYLKAELSSLMAFLIHSEEEKRQLSVEIQGLNDEIIGREQLVLEKEKVVIDMKAKLHTSFKEFLSMNKTMAVLRVEAAKGSEVTQGRNEILQRNLDKLARDYEGTTKQLTTAQDRIRELEFELEELVTQFNLTGEGKRASEEYAKKLSAELDRTMIELSQTQHNYQMTEMKRSQLDLELQEMQRLHTDTKYELDLRIGRTSKELATVTDQRNELEAALKSSKAENEKLSFSLKGVTRAKDQLESAFRVSTQKYEKEIQTRDTKIHELGNLRDEDAKGLKRVLEQKEQLMFQVTDLQNALNRETASLNMANFEMAQLKRQSDEKGTLLEDQVEKLNAARLTLAADKRQITERYKQTRLELQEREHELEHIKGEFARQKDRSAKTETELRGELVTIRDAHEKLKQDFASFEENLAAASTAKDAAEARSNTLEVMHAELVVREREALAGLAAAQRERDRCAADLAVAVTERADVKTHLDSVVTKVDELSRTMANMQSEFSTTVKEKDRQITKLSKESYEAREDANRLDKLSKKLKKLVDKLDGELHTTKAALTSETGQREFLEGTLYDIRQSLHAERQIRLEFERMHARLDRKEAEREASRLASLRLRERLLNEVAQGLNSEHARLDEISTMLPKEPEQAFMDAPEIKDFRPADVPGLGAHRSPTPGFKLVIRKPGS
ncbi:hypothetical protein BDZ88DRAFT_506306 [Geranomyces variabilis]|nr:hypothetical protein BDZ88DRAFT_506306 [Geranomyces variabilis]KAJ3141810.1 hypothetical protein HDU90_006159 [Geranomyces variabilis]